LPGRGVREVAADRLALSMPRRILDGIGYRPVSRSS
jgi:hypothetical protein